MIDDIQKEVEYQIKISDWMDEDTKDFILAKLVNMDKVIGLFPNWYRNNTIVKRYFQGVSLSKFINCYYLQPTILFNYFILLKLVLGNSYYENTLSYKRYSKWKELRMLIKEDEDDDE